MAGCEIGAKVRVPKDGKMVLAVVEGQTPPHEPVIGPGGRKRDGCRVKFLEGDAVDLSAVYLPEEMRLVEPPQRTPTSGPPPQRTPTSDRPDGGRGDSSGGGQ